MILLAGLLAVIHGLALITLASAPTIFLASRRRVRWLEHLFLVVGAITAISFLATGECVLTLWEQRLRAQFAPETNYTTGFISHYLRRVGLNWPDSLTLPLALVFMTLGLAGVLRWRWQRDPRGVR